MAKAVKRTARQWRMDKGTGRWRRRTRKVRNCWEPNWVNLQVEKTTKGTEARRIAIASALSLPLRRPSWATNGALQSRFQGRRLRPSAIHTVGMPGSSSTAAEFGRSPSAKSTHEGNSKPTSCNSRPHPLQANGGEFDRETCQDALADCKVSVPDHEQLTWSKQHCVDPIRLQTTVLLQSFSRWLSGARKIRQRHWPTAIVVMGGTIKGQFRINGPQEEVGFRCSAKQEEKPSCLYQKAGILSKRTEWAAVFSANLCAKFPGSSHPATGKVGSPLQTVVVGSTSLAATCSVAHTSGTSK